MMTTLSRNTIYGRTYCALEHLGSVQKETIRFIRAKRRKGEIDIQEKQSFTTPDDITTYISGQQHAHLVINNYQVLYKSVDDSGTVPAEHIISLAFPNIVIEDFYFEIIKTPQKSYVFICRKSYIDGLILQYQAHKVFITGWTLGVAPTVPVLPLIEKTSVIYSSTYMLIQEQQELIGIQFHEEENLHSYMLEELSISSRFLNVMGGLIIAFSPGAQTTASNSFEPQNDKRALYVQHRLFTIGLPTAIVTLLLIFAVNAFYYSHYYKGVETLGQIADANVVQKKQLLLKDSIVSQKQKLFEDVIESASSSSSLFVDEIVQLMPEVILLEELYYHPLLRKKRPNKPLQLQLDALTVSGKTTHNDALTHWISEIEQLKFIENVAINTLEKQGNATYFELELRLNTL